MTEYSNSERKLLLDLALDSIKYGLEHRQVIAVNLASFSPHLQQHRATFVTLHLTGELRGCIGTLEAYQPLITDITHNAFAAAFADPRFSPVTKEEFPALELHISVLSPSAPIKFTSEQDLLKQLRPNIDGLILSDHGHRGTFLPSVWEQLPDATEFLTHLKLKAGLPPNYWSDTLRVDRYTTESFTYEK